MIVTTSSVQDPVSHGSEIITDGLIDANYYLSDSVDYPLIQIQLPTSQIIKGMEITGIFYKDDSTHLIFFNVYDK